jgi:FMN phosphatase YigB (HAD superfamily)
METVDPAHSKNPTSPLRRRPKPWHRSVIERISSGFGSWHNTSQYERAGAQAQHDIVFLLDVDNTLLDNDRIEADLKNYLVTKFGAENRDRYWALLEGLRVELGYADYLGALQIYRRDDLNDPNLMLMSSFLVDYPFSKRLYPRALDAVKHLRRLGLTVILSDGDVVFQPRKIQHSRLWDAVDGRVLVYIHKEKMLDAIMQRYPARHYVMVDDKLSILTAMKCNLGARLTTVYPRQGHYALDPTNLAAYPAPDVSIDNIGDLIQLDLPALLGAAVSTQMPPT